MARTIHREECVIDGNTISIETGRVAAQADGAVVVSCGGTTVLVVAVSSNEAVKELDYFPLTVHYSERFYAAGKIPGGFIKRESRPGDREVLVSRLIDRPIRPLFPEDYQNEVQVTAITLSADSINPPDILAMIGASAALNISDIPFKKILAAVRVSRVEGKLVANPTYEQMALSDLDIVIAGSKDAILMVEGGAKQVPEADILSAIKFGHEKIQASLEMQERLVAKMAVKKRDYEKVGVNDKLRQFLRQKFTDELLALIRMPDKKLRNKATAAFEARVKASVKPEDYELNEKGAVIQSQKVLEEIESELLRNFVKKEKVRLDGRKFNEIRPITVEIGVLPRTHGSAIFTRGQTQSLGVTTLGTIKDEQRFDDLLGEHKKRFILHYNFPQFSVGETGRVGSPGRREIGHGMLAMRSIEPVLPANEDFPYTIRIVSDILESNGSSSMASVCSGTLSLLQAGVPVKASVAGIAMGLIQEGSETFVLSDIAGSEDHFGDMDFKVAGTRQGITGFQMDIKIDGLSFEIMGKALAQACEGRNHILDKMDEVIAKPATELSEFAPRIVFMKIDPAKIKDVIGSGGSVIREICETTDTEINIEDDGTVQIAGKDLDAVAKARQTIEAITAEPELGKSYEGKVKRIFEYGVLVAIMGGGKQGLLHVSKMPIPRGARIEDHFKIGDSVTVKIIKIEFDRGKQLIDFGIAPQQK